jgi:hypothetical protein
MKKRLTSRIKLSDGTKTTIQEAFDAAKLHLVQMPSYGPLGDRSLAGWMHPDHSYAYERASGGKQRWELTDHTYDQLQLQASLR